MYKKLLFFLITALLTITGIAQAEPDGLVDFNLSLAGYRLGMPFDEAAAVRPFQYIQDRPENSDDIPVIDAYIDQVYIDDLETKLWLQFKQGKVVKIIVRFSPDAIEEMSQRLEKTLGKGNDKSRIVTTRDGKEVQQTICQWIFPHAKLHLIGISSNIEYATLSLVAKRKRSAEEN